MGIDEAGHHYPSGGVHLDGVARLGQVFDPPARAHFHQDSIPYEDGAVLNGVEFFE